MLQFGRGDAEKNENTLERKLKKGKRKWKTIWNI